MIRAGDPLEQRFKMTVSTAQVGGTIQRGVTQATPRFF
jgi:hypothetical protein